MTHHTGNHTLTSGPISDTLPNVNSPSTGMRKLAVLLCVVGLFGGLYWQFGDSLSLEQLAAQEAAFRNFQQQHPLLIYVVAFTIYVVVAGLSLPGAAAMTLLCGWLFGIWRAVILVSFASTSGAALAFLLSRYLLRDVIQQRFGDRLAGFNSALEREGAFYLFTLRLIPAVPFFVINVVMGLTPIRVRTFWWVSQIGMLAGTAVYVYAGAAVPNLAELAAQGTSGILTPRLIIAFVLLGVFPLIVKTVMSRFRSNETTESPSINAGNNHGGAIHDHSNSRRPADAVSH